MLRQRSCAASGYRYSGYGRGRDNRIGINFFLRQRDKQRAIAERRREVLSLEQRTRRAYPLRENYS